GGRARAAGRRRGPGNGAGERNVPVVTFATARRLASEFGTPLLVLSEEKLRANVADLQSSLSGVRLCYAVKANPDAEVLKILLQEGLGFDVSSPEEIRRVLDLGGRPEDLLYTKPINKQTDLEYAHRA